MLRIILENHNVSTTALLANYWKHETKSKNNWPALCIEQGERTKDLFKDPLMQYFIDPSIKVDAEERLDKRMWLPLGLRTCFFRKTISQSIKCKDVKQIIILGSGFDTLPVRKSAYSKDFGVKFFEIDQPNILNCKQAIYEKQGIDKNAKYIPLDYIKEDLIGELEKRNIDFSAETLILWEGNTFYLEKSDAIRILEDLSSNFKKLIITFDYMHAAMQEKAKILDNESNEQSIEGMLTQFTKKQSPFKTFFEPSELISICEKFGIKCIANKTGAELAVEYDVDRKPYYSSHNYAVATFEKI